MTTWMAIEADAATGAKRLVQYERRSLELSVQQWRVLEALARELGCKAAGGSRTGKASWRTLVRLISAEQLTVRKA